MSRAGDTARPLHVLVLTPFFPSDRNEVHGCFIAEPLEHLRQFGIDSSVIAVSPVHYARKQSMASAPAEWVRYPQLPGIAGLSSAGRFLYPCLRQKVQKLHSTKPIDLIHAHGALPCGHAAALLFGRLKIPFVVTVHGLDVFNACTQEGVWATWRRKTSAEVYGAARNVICISGKVQEIVKTGTPAETRSTIIYNAVNPQLFSSNANEREESVPQLLMVGNLLPIKGHDLVLRALAKLKRSFPPVQCRIIGEGPARARFRALARELGIEQQVQFAGRQSREEVAEAMRRCTVFVLPTRYEGLGCVYLEAMSCGKPAIGCRGQGIDEVIEHGKNGWLIGVDKLEELVEGLSVLLGSAELRASIGAAARQTILGKFTLSRHAQQLAELYRQAVA